METCPFCKGLIEVKAIEHLHKWGNDIYLFRNVKAEVCQQCGEVFLYPYSLKSMDKCVKKKKKGYEVISIPVINLPEKGAA